MGLERLQRISLPTRVDQRGSLAFLEAGRHVPIAIERIYYLYDVPPGESRGAHAHRALEQVFIAISGAFDLTLDDGQSRRTLRLSSPAEALYVPPIIWRDIDGFSPGAVCMVLASAPFDEGDYIRSYDQFLREVRGPGR